MLRAAIYTRISRDDADERLGVQRQEKDLRREAKRRDAAVLSVFEDNDISGTANKRPDFDRMIEAIDAGEIDLVLSADLDRLTRGFKSYVKFYEACERAKVIVAWLGGEANFATGLGLLELDIRASFAREELRKLKVRVVRKHLELAENGKDAGGGRPFGYQVDRKALNESEAAWVREAASRVLDGEPIRSVCRDWNARAIPTVTEREHGWTPQVMRRMLASARISGRREYRRKDGRTADMGEIMNEHAEWTGIITVEQSNALRKLFSDPARRLNQVSGDYLLTGTLSRCSECGGPLYARPKDGHRSMVCARGPGFKGCGKIRIQAEPFERLVTEAVLQAVDAGALAAVMAHQGDAEAVDGLIAVEAKMIENRRDWAEGRIERSEWEAGRAVLETQRVSLQRRVDVTHRAHNLDGLSGPLRAAWPTLPNHKRRAVIAALVETVVVSPAVQGRNFFAPERVEIIWRKR